MGLNLGFINEPFALLLRAFYSFTKNYALALIFFTLVVKIVFSFVNILQHRSARGQARIKPKMNAIRKRYVGRTDANVQMEFQADMQKLYKEEKVSNSIGCLPLLIQLFIVMVLYQIVYNPLTYISRFEATDLQAINTIIVENFASLKISDTKLIESISEVINDTTLVDISAKVSALKLTELQQVSIITQNSALFPTYAANIPNFTIFGGAIDLSQNPKFAWDWPVLIPVLTVIFQLGSVFITKLVGPKTDTTTPEAKQAAKTMLITNLRMTLVTGYIAFSFPAIIGVYWIYQSIFGTIISVILHLTMPIPSYTNEEILAIEEEYNKDYVRPEIPVVKSIHDYDDEEDVDGEEEVYDYVEVDEDSVQTFEDTPMPERRRYDKDGNKIHSLHFIDEDEDEVNTETAEQTAEESEDTDEN